MISTMAPLQQDAMLNDKEGNASGHTSAAEWNLADITLLIGHELRNQLAVLQLAVDKLHYEFGTELSQKQTVAIKRIVENISRVECTAHSYLHIATLNDPDFRPRKILVDPVIDLIEPWLSANESFLQENHQTLMIEPLPESLQVWADPDMLYSVVDNLLGNAIKYGDPGSMILVRLMDRGSSVSFRIWNRGRGIKPDSLETVFDRFANCNGIDGTCGRGLGLYLSRRVIEVHGGRIWADSRVGEWASFTFTLPKRGF